MSKKNKTKNKHDRDGTPRQHQSTEAAAEFTPGSRRLTPIKVGIGLGIVVLGGAVLLGPACRGRDRAVLPGTAVGTTQPASAAVTPAAGGAITPAVASLPPPAPGTRVPLNDVDPVTGKPITPSSPTLDYKGYAIGFCCASSEGYKGAWALWSESQKDAFVRRYLK